MAQARSRELDVLADAGWLVDTPVRFRDAVLDRCLIHRYRKGDAVYRTGDPPGGLYGLIEGSVGVELSPHDRAPYIGTFARPGFWIGEGSVLTRGPRYIGIRATRDSLLAYLPIPQWDAVVQSEPDAWRWFGFLALRNTLLALSVVDALMISVPPSGSRRSCSCFRARDCPRAQARRSRSIPARKTCHGWPVCRDRVRAGSFRSSRPKVSSRTPIARFV